MKHSGAVVAVLVAVFLIAGCRSTTTAAHSSAPAKPTVSPQQHYLAALRQEGLTAPDSQLLGDGYAICGQLDNGADPHRVLLDRITAYASEGLSGLSTSVQQYGSTFAAAAKWLCPDHLDAVVAAVKSIDSWANAPTTTEAPATTTQESSVTEGPPDVTITWPTETETVTETPTTTATPETTYKPDDPWVAGQREDCRKTHPASEC